MNFTKIHVNGNDYIYVKCLEDEILEPEKLSRKISHRRYGIGADGLVMILPSSMADCSMKIYNSDGSPAEICGNALMSVGLYLYKKNNVDNSDSFAIQTSAGIKRVNVTDGIDGLRVEANLGKPNFAAKDIPVMTAQEEFYNRIISLGDKNYIVTCVSMGNPHAVIIDNDISEINLDKVGPRIQNLEIFPEGVNVEFIQIENRNLIKMKVYERGSGETWSCGSGACASVAVAVRNCLCGYDENVKVIVKGGELMVKCLKNRDMIISAKPELIFDGTYII